MLYYFSVNTNLKVRYIIRIKISIGDSKMNNGKNDIRQKAKNMMKVSLEGASLVLCEKIPANQADKDVYIMIPESVKKHSKMSYLTDTNTLDLIFSNMTLQSSSLKNASLNDKMEKERVDIEQFAGSRFITCFSHNTNENVAMWKVYGNQKRPAKVLLQFKNFANDLKNCIYMDFGLVADNKKCFFNSQEYTKTVNQNGVLGRQKGLPPINLEFDTDACIRSVSVIDINYVASDSEPLNKRNVGDREISFDHGSKIDIKTFDTSELGTYKSTPWEYEKETRILMRLSNQKFDRWDYIRLRLKDEMFRDLKIIMSPWVDEENKLKIKSILDGSKLATDIKESITICQSELEGTLNFPD